MEAYLSEKYGSADATPFLCIVTVKARGHEGGYM